MYIIVSGRVRFRHVEERGRAFVVETFGPKEFFGEMSLFAETTHPANIVAAEDCELVYIPRKLLLEVLGQSSAAAMSLLRVALKRLSRANRQMANLALSTVYIRVVQVLLDNGHESDGEWHVSVGSEEIAEMAGASREMVNKVLRCMIAKRVIRRDKRKIIVMDPGAFRI